MEAIFDDDQGLPLDVQAAGVEDRTGATVHDISYAGFASSRVRAYLVRPPGAEPWAGLIFVHPGLGDRTNFLDESVELARAGALSLVVEAPWAQGLAWGETLADPEYTQQEYVRIARDLRRAIDLVLAQPGIDARRIGYVGHSFGALFGGLLAGVERRVKAYVLMAGVGSFTDVALVNMPGLQGEALEARRRLMDPIDPIHYVPRAAPAALFYQFSLRDNFFPREKFVQFYEAGSQPKLIRWYDADHYQINNAGRADRIEWLNTQLALR